MQTLAFSSKLTQINESNWSVLLEKQSLDQKIARLIALYATLGEEYEKLISQTQDWVEAFRLQIFLENTVTLARHYLSKIQDLYTLSASQKTALEHEIDNFEELGQDIKLKFFQIPQNPNIQEVLAK